MLWKLFLSYLSYIKQLIKPYSFFFSPLPFLTLGLPLLEQPNPCLMNFEYTLHVGALNLPRISHILPCFYLNLWFLISQSLNFSIFKWQRNERYTQAGSMQGRPDVESPKQQQPPLGPQVGPPPGFGRGNPVGGVFEGPNSKRCRYWWQSCASQLLSIVTFFCFVYFSPRALDMAFVNKYF